jgi:hyperosmotically inducible periplasmic protein
VDKTIKRMLQLAALAFGVLTLPCAYAQDAAASASVAPASSPAASAGSAASSKKAMKAADRKLARTVRKAIEHVKGLDATRIAIVARDGNVTLTGSVPAAPQVDVAVQAAKTVPGVTAVVNRLEVGEVGP